MIRPLQEPRLTPFSPCGLKVPNPDWLHPSQRPLKISVYSPPFLPSLTFIKTASASTFLPPRRRACSQTASSSTYLCSNLLATLRLSSSDEFGRQLYELDSHLRISCSDGCTDEQELAKDVLRTHPAAKVEGGTGRYQGMF